MRALAAGPEEPEQYQKASNPATGFPHPTKAIRSGVRSQSRPVREQPRLSVMCARATGHVEQSGTSALRERSRGVFYIRSRAFLHFHEDPSGLFADVRLILDEDFVRIRVSSGPERARLLKAIEKTCAERD